MDQSAFLFTPDSPISSLGETMYSSSQNDSSPLVESDFQAPENSSSDEEACFAFDVHFKCLRLLPPLLIVEVVPSNISSDEDNDENKKRRRSNEGRLKICHFSSKLPLILRV
jgi:hypothetical protein